MQVIDILYLYIGLRAAQHFVERYLSFTNRRYYSNQQRLANAAKILNISPTDLSKTIDYTEDKYRFGAISSWLELPITLVFLYIGGLGVIETFAADLSRTIDGSALSTGVIFFLILGLLSMLVSLPFELYNTFQIEEKHGFNRQTLKSFFVDKLKGLFVGALLGIPLLSVLLWVMEKAGDLWWVYAWLLLFGFSLFAVWIYPTVLAPLFNKFTPLDDGELKVKIEDLANRVAFQADGISIMDASKRSSHGNAYFTGVFGKKKIVLFDTLVKAMNVDEITAVLAHELGHFKLNHIRIGLIRSFFSTGLMFYGMSLMMPYEKLYTSLGLSGASSYGALTVFSLWFGLVSFLFQPFASYLSRKNEFAADAFALKHIPNRSLLGDALLKLRENSNLMPISHPLYSRFYHSHPPLIERLAAMNYNNPSDS